MAEETHATESPTTTDGDQAAQDTPQTPPATKSDMTVEDYKAALAKANAEAAKYRTQRNELRTDAEKYRQIQEAEKTELQRAQEALEAQRAEAARYQTELARHQALAKYGISEDNADLLGSDPEKFEANAQRLGELQAQAARRAAPPSDYPVEDLKPGASDRLTPPDVSYPATWPVQGQFAGK